MNRARSDDEHRDDFRTSFRSNTVVRKKCLLIIGTLVVASLWPTRADAWGGFHYSYHTGGYGGYGGYRYGGGYHYGGAYGGGGYHYGGYGGYGGYHYGGYGGSGGAYGYHYGGYPYGGYGGYHYGYTRVY
jgi:hypothetical protein